ncbi:MULTISPECIES: hypothetical protein [Stutzerimonas]|jgi:hypothetical protein|uniref:hypothetical protein n=1 Tax=Stutzerimonas TaxID=2901164 RepID=UPI00241E2CA5|nr:MULTISPECIES: hypothetical protein [Stutzerimonas]MDL2172703.1 hypothetical protein [Stutzerimonas sp. FeSN7]|tara:strand:- start:24666 stop:26639 length:1974 start_codon:yes stop_codon:yes gene_type:complete
MINKMFLKRRPANKAYIGFAAIALAYALLLHHQLGMDAFYDTANYHIYIGWAASRLSSYVYGAVAQYHTYLNPLLDVVNFTLFSLHPLVGATYHALAFALLLCTVFAIANRVTGVGGEERPLLAGAAVAIGATAAMTVSLYGSFTNEHLVALVFMPALWLVLCYLDGGPPRCLFLAGLLSGFAVGLKLTAAPLMASLLLSVFIIKPSAIRGWFLAGVFAGVGVLLGDGLFMLLRWDLTGNPIFPLANNIFQSTLYPSQWVSFGEFRMAELPQYLALPFHWLSNGTYSEVDTVRDGRLLLAYSGLFSFCVGLVLHKQKPTRKELFLILFFVLSWALWIALFRIYRYLVVLELLSGIIFLLGLNRLLPGKSITVPAVILPLACLFLYVTTVYPNWGRRPWSSEFSQTDIHERLSKGATVLFAENRTSFLAPELHALGVNFGNLLSQPWYDADRQRNPIDPKATAIDSGQPLYFVQYTETDLREHSPTLSAMFGTRLFVCEDIQTNMNLNPKLCAYLSAEQLPRLEPGKRYDFRSQSITFVSGWSYPEQTHRWSNDKEAVLEFRLTSDAFTECAKPAASLSGFSIDEQRVAIATPTRERMFRTVQGPFEIAIPLSLEGADWLAPLQIRLELPDAHPPSPSDQRLLGIALQGIGLQCDQPQ